MDNIVVIGNDYVEIAKLKRNLAKEFVIKGLGSLKYFLRIEGCQVQSMYHPFSKKVCSGSVKKDKNGRL